MFLWSVVSNIIPGTDVRERAPKPKARSDLLSAELRSRCEIFRASDKRDPDVNIVFISVESNLVPTVDSLQSHYKRCIDLV